MISHVVPHRNHSILNLCDARVQAFKNGGASQDVLISRLAYVSLINPNLAIKIALSLEDRVSKDSAIVYLAEDLIKFENNVFMYLMRLDTSISPVFDKNLFSLIEQISNPQKRDALYCKIANLLMANIDSIFALKLGPELIEKVHDVTLKNILRLNFAKYFAKRNYFKEALDLVLGNEFSKQGNVQNQSSVRADTYSTIFQLVNMIGDKKIKFEACTAAIKYFFNEQVLLNAFLIAFQMDERGPQELLLNTVLVLSFNTNREVEIFRNIQNIPKARIDHALKNVAKYYFAKKDFLNGCKALCNLSDKADIKKCLFNVFKSLIIPYGSTADRQIVFFNIHKVEASKQNEIITLAVNASFRRKELDTALNSVKSLSDPEIKFRILNLFVEKAQDYSLFESIDARDNFITKIIDHNEVNQIEKVLDIVIKACSIKSFINLAEYFQSNNQLEYAILVFKAFKAQLERMETPFIFPKVIHPSESVQGTLTFTWTYKGIQRSCRLVCDINPDFLGRVSYLIPYIYSQIEILGKMSAQADEIEDPEKRMQIKAKIIALDMALVRLESRFFKVETQIPQVDWLSHVKILHERTKYSSTWK